MNITILYNPDCSKSKAVLKILQSRGAKITLRNYLTSPLEEKEITELLSILKLDNPVELARPTEKDWERLGLNNESTCEDIIKAIVKHPILLQRPIIVSGKKAIIARPPDRALELIDLKITT